MTPQSNEVFNNQMRDHTKKLPLVLYCSINN